MKKSGPTIPLKIQKIPLTEIPAGVLAEITVIGAKNGPHRSNKRAHQATGKPKKVRVMVIDDDCSVAESTAQLFDRFGYECYAVYSAADALACAESFEPDVVLSDVIMPGMNGVELCLQIKQMLPSCRILLFSGEVSLAYTLTQDARKHGHSFELLDKPLHPRALVHKISNLFGGAYSPVQAQL
jgi:CheY-like chemotaxis protein